MADKSPGNSEWVRAALDRYERPLIRYATRITGDLEQARDVVQDTFLRLCTVDRTRVDRHLGQWLYTVCRNRALDVLKKEGRMDSLCEGQVEALESRDPPPNTAAELNEAHRIVLDVLATLPARQQEVFRLKFQDGMSYREIRSMTGYPLSTVSSLIRTAINSIREQLRDQFDLAVEA